MSTESAPILRDDAQLLAVNLQFYDGLWSDARLVEPQRFNTWPLVSRLAARAPRRLEVAPGLRPRLPIPDTQFVDISAPALAKLSARGARTQQAPISALPFADGSFDLVCALDIIEHVDDDERALAELARVAAPGAALILSTPLHPAMWTAFDDFVGHRRRYEPQQILAKLAAHGFAVEQSAVFGMKPKSNGLVRIGMWFLVHRRRRAMWLYNRVLMPLGVHFQKPLTLHDGMVATDDVAEVLLVCRKRLPRIDAAATLHALLGSSRPR
ncbi:MAG: class I SAM-dependent methyltransferase [Stenotrophobium sp.]